MAAEFAPHRAVCLRCRRPQAVCWCQALRPIESRTRVIFIQHPREARVPVSTCRMAHLSLPNSELHIGLGAQGVAHLEALGAEEGAAVLFPSLSATEISSLDEAPRTLVVVDGTWSNAKKIVERCPVLSRLPRLAYRPTQPGAYRIRREPQAHCLSTIEAVAFVLEHLERAPGRFTPMLTAFEYMIQRQLDFIAAGGNQSRHRRGRKRNSRRADPTAFLRAHAARVVALFGEANAWPAHTAPARPTELLQLVAVRLSTGERFETFLAPSGPLSPTAALHLGLSSELLSRAPSRQEALSAFRAWAGEEDLFLGWGRFCRDLLEAEGMSIDRFLDLRSVLGQVARRRPGSVESLAARLGEASIEGRGRAERRLAALEAVAKATLDGRLEKVLCRTLDQPPDFD